MNLDQEVLTLLDATLGLHGRTATFTDDTPLLGSLPELDSMAVVGLITALEEQFGMTVDDDEISGATFATVGTLKTFVRAKLYG